MGKRKADCTPEEWAAHLERQREWYANNPAVRERQRERDRARQANPACREKKRALERKRRADSEYREKYRERYANNLAVRERKRERHRAWHREKKTGFSPALVATLVALQGNRCAVCDHLFTGQFQADHCHDTGRPRGLLCFACNTMEGRIRRLGLRPAEFAERLQSYLDNPPAAVVGLAG